VVDRTIQREETSLDQVLDREGILQLRAACREVLVAQHVKDYAVDLVMATQPGSSGAHELANKFIRYGSSPRGAQAMVECGRVVALMNGRVNLSVEDIRSVAASVLRHRIILNFDAHAENQTPDSILNKIIYAVTTAAGSR
jgi:MoxR-like ATPase